MAIRKVRESRVPEHKRIVRTGITLELNQTAVIDLHLEVAAPTDRSPRVM